MADDVGARRPGRRDVLTGIAAGAAAALAGPRTLLADEGRARVVRVESDRLWRGDRRVPEVVAEMIDRGVVALSGERTPGAAWRRFIGPHRRVGLKINLLGRPLLYTAVEVTDAVTAALIAAGIEAEKIVVWDRPESHFAPTAYRIGRGRHGESVEGGGRYAFSYADERSYVSTSKCGELPVDLIPLTRTDATISLPVLKDHGISGVTGALKNVAFGCYHTTPQAHDDCCDPFIAEAYQHFTSVNSVPLIVLDATRGCFEGGPVPQGSKYVWSENAVYLSTDPVALDRVCCERIDAKRAGVGLGAAAPRAKHLRTAAAKGLGVVDRDRIDLVTVGVS